MDSPARLGRTESQLRTMIVAAACILFACAATRHFLFCSDGDLAVFDHGAYLISRAGRPITSIYGFHILGDHVALILYPIAALYMLYPTPLWLLLIQAVALSIGAWPMWKLARHAGLGEESALTMAAAYLLYPVLFNANIADFHPEVIAVPTLLATVLAARCKRLFWFCAGILVILACKEVLGVTVFGMGVWLYLCEKRRSYGALAAIAGSVWFGVAITVIVPTLTGSDPPIGAANSRYFMYAYLGGSTGATVKNLVSRPWLALSQLFSISILGYLASLVSPVLWGLAPTHLAPVIGAVPQLTLNLLSEGNITRHPTNQYSLPVFPFLLLAVLATVAAGKRWVRSRRVILAWCAIGFLVFARYPRIIGYFQNLQQWQASRAALQQIAPEMGVLTDSCFVSHVTDRRSVYFLARPANLAPIPEDVRYVLINSRNPCELTLAATAEIVQNLRGSSDFQVLYEQDGIILFTRRRPSEIPKPSS